jgi:DNA-directed RNA polymerase specialized sigma24 family protein
MSSAESVSDWLEQLQAGDHSAAQKLWQRYFHRLVQVARAKLRETPLRAADEEDVALSAFDSFCRAAERGQFPRLRDRDDLWRLLLTITSRKASRRLRDEGRQKRGGRNGDPADADRPPVDFDQILGQEPSPDFAAQVAEEYQRLLDGLKDAQLRSIALWKMEGFTAQEIATRLSCSIRTVERRLQLIRSAWKNEITP